MLAAKSMTHRLLGRTRVPGPCAAVLLFLCQHNRRTRRRDGRQLVGSAAPSIIITGPMTTSAVAFHSSMTLSRSIRRPIVVIPTNYRLGCDMNTLASRCSARLLSSTTYASLLGDDGFDPFTTHHNAKDADRADRMVRDYVKRRLAGGSGIGIRNGFAEGALNSYRVLSEKAAERARRVSKDTRPDTTFAKKADDLLAFVEQAYVQDPDLSPCTKSYNMVVNAYAKVGDPQSAEAVLLRMEKLLKSGNEKVKPDTILYNAVIDAWAKSGRREAPVRAEAILKHMEQLNQQGHEDVRPDYISYNAVINAWAKSREKGAAQRAEAILNHMLKLHEGGREDCLPTDISFTTVIDAWAKSEDAKAYDNAMRTFNLLRSVQGNGYSNIKPSNTTYNALMNTLAVSRIPDKAPRAYKILLEMEERGKDGEASLAPNTQSYGTVLKVCARATKGSSKRKDETLRIALTTFEKLRKNADLPIDPYKYAPLFVIIDNTSKGETHAKLTREVFRLCCEDGVLTDKQLESLRRYTPKGVFRKLVGTNAGVTVRDLPPEWSRKNRQR